MVRIKAIFADHPLLGLGVVLFMFVNISLGWLSKFYDNMDQVPGFIIAALIVVLLSSFILTAIGGVLSIGKQAGAKGFKQTVRAFVKGYWRAAKIPLLLTLLIFIGLTVYAFLVN